MPIVVACQHLATYGALTRGFRVEHLDSIGYAAQFGTGGLAIFSGKPAAPGDEPPPQGGRWYTLLSPAGDGEKASAGQADGGTPPPVSYEDLLKVERARQLSPPPAPPPLVPPQRAAFVLPHSPTERDEVSPWAANARAWPAADGSRLPAPPRAEAVPTPPGPPAPTRRADTAPKPPSPPERADIPQGTADIADFVPRPEMPFQAGQARAAGQSAPEGKRLQRFDPQTGNPLDPPIWVDALKPGD